MGGAQVIYHEFIPFIAVLLLTAGVDIAKCVFGVRVANEVPESPKPYWVPFLAAAAAFGSLTLVANMLLHTRMENVSSRDFLQRLDIGVESTGTVRGRSLGNNQYLQVRTRYWWMQGHARLLYDCHRVEGVSRADAPQHRPGSKSEPCRTYSVGTSLNSQLQPATTLVPASE